VFRNEDGSHVHPALFSLAFKTAAKKAGLPMRLHDTRHTHVALLGAARVHPKVVQGRVGHADPGFTLREYGGAFPEQHREAASQLADLLDAEH
jgi:integrase